MDLDINKRMEIYRIKVGGYTNIKQAELKIEGLTALVAPNNYGKSNVLSAISFATEFMRCTPTEKVSMMKYRPVIPINTSIASIPFTFEMEGKMSVDSISLSFIYGFSLEWAKDEAPENGARITEEYLKVKNVDDIRYANYIIRSSSEEAKYLGTPKGRCDKTLQVLSSQLSIDKLASYDDLFYVGISRQLIMLDVKTVNTLIDPDGFFTPSSTNDIVNGYSTCFPEKSNAGFFIYSLRQLQPDKYQLLKNVIMSLIDDIEDFEPIQVSMRKENEMTVANQSSDLLYDIRVKERFNNQYTSISRISSGSKRIIYVLALTLAASINNTALITFEELENSVHPRLLENLLEAVCQLADKCKILVTSHSPYLVKYLKAEHMYLGMPNSEGVADFRALRPNKIKKVVRMASSEETTLGEYLFELMLDMDNDDTLLNEYFK